jgi:nucleoid-associated protein YgaU
MSEQKRHVSFSEIGLRASGRFGHPNQTQSLEDLVNKPPLARGADATELLSLLVYQQSALIDLMLQTNNTLDDMRRELSAVRRDMKSSQTRVAAAREKAAKAEEKAANARERAATAEAEANAKITVHVIQAGGDLRKLDERIKRKF